MSPASTRKGVAVGFGRLMARLRAPATRASCTLLALAAGSALAAPGEPCTPTIDAPGFCGDGARATDARLAAPFGIARLPDGGFLVADSGNNRIRKVLPGGRITTVAGTGSGGDSGDGGPAIKAELSLPTGIAVVPTGGFLIADSANNRVRRVAPNGRITTVAGTGSAGFSGDGGPATQAELVSPTNVAVTEDGGFLIADNGNRRIRQVSGDGVIATVAGTGRAGSSGDGGPATEADLDRPAGVAAMADGAFLVADSGSNRIRHVSADGLIATVAGTGRAGFSGDGFAATKAELDSPSDVALRRQGRGGFLIADSGNQAVRRVSASGEIATLAGTGTAGFSGDGGPAVDAQLTAPTGVATAGQGALIADNGNARIRAVSGGGTIATVAGSGPVSEEAAILARQIADAKRGTTGYFFPRVGTKEAGERFRLGYVVTSKARVRIRILRRSNVVRSERDRADTGSNAQRFRPLRSGRYTARLFVEGGRRDDRQTVKLR